MHTWPASSFTEAGGSLAMHFHYRIFKLSISLRKFPGKPLVCALLRSMTHSSSSLCSAGELFLWKIIHATLPSHCRQASKGGNIPFSLLWVKPVAIPLRSVDPHWSITNVTVSWDWLFGSSTSLGTAAQPLLPTSVLNFRYSAPSIPMPPFRWFYHQEEFLCWYYSQGGRESGTSFSNDSVGISTTPSCFPLPHAHTHTKKKTKAKKPHNNVTAGL